MELLSIAKNFVQLVASSVTKEYYSGQVMCEEILEKVLRRLEPKMAKTEVSKLFVVDKGSKVEKRLQVW